MKYRTKALSELALPFLDPVVRKSSGLSVEIINNWVKIVGADIAKLCSPIKISWPNKKIGTGLATLIIYAKAGTSLILMHRKSEIIERINSYFGCWVIDQIKTTQTIKNSTENRTYGSVDNGTFNVETTRKIDQKYEKQIEKLVKDISDDALRLALSRIGHSIYSKKI